MITNAIKIFYYNVLKNHRVFFYKEYRLVDINVELFEMAIKYHEICYVINQL